MAAGAIGLVVIVVAAALLAGGSGRGEPPPRRLDGGYPDGSAQGLKRRGMAELALGRSVYGQARPGSRGEQAKLREARRHLEAAQGLLDRAHSALPRDRGLAAAVEECNRLLYGCLKRTTVDVR
jgi:hypothetical protein